LLEEHYRAPKAPEIWFTEAELPLDRYLDRPVYLLTSRSTWSAAEAFCDILKHRSRVTIVGDRTRGGANGTTAFVSLSRHFDISLPICRMINPVTGTNWEGTGVEPHVEVSSEQALKAALQMAVG
jgi:C-terminal processing protease CtpA/Prc